MILKKNYFTFAFFIAFSVPFSIYAEPSKPNSTLAIRSLQTRDFSNISQEQAYQAAITTFQDLGFLITETSKTIGLIEANQIHPDQSEVLLATLTLSKNSTNPNHITARLSLSAYPILNGEEGGNLNGGPPRKSETVQSPTTYQQFFNAFSYSLQFNAPSVTK